MEPFEIALCALPAIIGGIGLAAEVLGGFLGGDDVDGPRWSQQHLHRDPSGRSQKAYRQATGLPTGKQGGFKNLSPADQERFLSGKWGTGGNGIVMSTPGISGIPGGPAALPGGFTPQPLASFAPSPGGVAPQATVGTALQAAARGAGGYLMSRVLGPRRPGGTEVGVRGANFYSTGGYPGGSDLATLEDLMEQTYTPDLWARRLARGIAVLAAPIKKNYSVPLIDITGDIEGRVRAVNGPIKKSDIILYGGGSVAPEEQPALLGSMLSGRKLTGTCEVVDEEGGDAMPTVGYVYSKPKRRRGGIHVGAKQLREYTKTVKALKALQKKIPAPLRRKR